MPQKKNSLIPHVPPFKMAGPESELLVISSAASECKVGKLKLLDINSDRVIDDNFKVSAFNMAMTLIIGYIDILNDLESCYELFGRCLLFLDSIPGENYPETIRNKINVVKKKVSELKKSRSRLVHEAKKPKALKLYDPIVEENFDPFQKKHKGSREKQEMSKLLYKVKRERKGAKKEIRNDSLFVAQERAKRLREVDEDRKAKTKKILSGLANQEGEYKKSKMALQRSRGKRKFK